eukprot:m.73544 g.73544  ORF g.73544 m.73544 type:complete len:360 (-) comp24570_c0_seq1:41-1120(-)
MGAGGGKFKYIEKSDPLAHWIIKGSLGQGSYGKVHLVQNRQNRSEAAAKVAEVDTVDGLYEFTTEIAMLANCRHPNITSFLAAYYDQKKLWIIIEKCSGGALQDLIKKNERGMNETEVAIAAAQLVHALTFLHAKAIIHRDLNAANVLLSGEGNIKIADFGVSKYLPKNGRCNSFIGSPNWMAPEVIECEQSAKKWYTNSADIWSLGITILEFVHMVPPHADLHPAKALIKIITGPSPKLNDPGAWDPQFPALLSKMLIKDPSRRHSAEELCSVPWIAGKETLDLMSMLPQTSGTPVFFEQISRKGNNNARNNPPRDSGPPSVPPLPPQPATDHPPRPIVIIGQAQDGYGVPKQLLAEQ